MKSGTLCILSAFLPEIVIQNLRVKFDPSFTEAYHAKPITKA